MTRKKAALLLMACLILSFTVAATTTSEQIAAAGTGAAYSDIYGHTGRSAIEKWSGYGVIRGYDGQFRPDDAITRGEMAAIMVRVIGYNKVSGTVPKDINDTQWFHNDVLKLYQAEVMQGDYGLFRPYSNITREEAICVISRAFGLAGRDGKDAEDLAPSDAHSWSKPHISAMERRGYLDIFGSKLNLRAELTRAELVMIIDSMFDGFFNKPGEYSDAELENVIIRSGNVAFRDITVTGDLYITEGVGNGFYTLDNVSITGDTIQRGGKLNPYPYIDPLKPMVAFTFDDGPSATTIEIVEVLKEHNSRATFCTVGYLISSYPESVKAVAESGSELATHTWEHTDITKLSSSALADDCKRVSDAQYELTGKRPTLIRPPYGNNDSTTSETMKGLEMATIFWSMDPRDWSHRDANTTYRHVMDNIEDGSIIGLHDSVPSTGEAMKMLVPELTKNGYQLVTASELITYTDIGFVPGKVYNSKYSFR